MKRGGGGNNGMHEELGYIPPPNRKLPPVPGTNYNTCDRIKRGKKSSLSLFVLLMQYRPHACTMYHLDDKRFYGIWFCWTLIIFSTCYILCFFDHRFILKTPLRPF